MKKRNQLVFILREWACKSSNQYFDILKQAYGHQPPKKKQKKPPKKTNKQTNCLIFKQRCFHLAEVSVQVKYQYFDIFNKQTNKQTKKKHTNTNCWSGIKGPKKKKKAKKQKNSQKNKIIWSLRKVVFTLREWARKFTN